MGMLEGNQVDVLFNGDEIFPAMLHAIRSASRQKGCSMITGKIAIAEDTS